MKSSEKVKKQKSVDVIAVRIAEQCECMPHENCELFKPKETVNSVEGVDNE